MFCGVILGNGNYVLIATLMSNFHFLQKKLPTPPELFASENLKGVPLKKFLASPSWKSPRRKQGFLQCHPFGVCRYFLEQSILEDIWNIHLCHCYMKEDLSKELPLLALADTSQKITNSLEPGEDGIMSLPNSDG